MEKKQRARPAGYDREERNVVNRIDGSASAETVKKQENMANVER